MPMNIKNIYSCPKCGHSVGKWRKLNAGIFSQWHCKNCGTLLKVTYWKGMIFIFMLALLIYFWINPQRNILHIQLLVLGLIIFDILAKMFISPIVESEEKKKISACPECGHLTDWRHRLNVRLFSQWSCKNCSTILGFSYWPSLILIPMFALLLYLWIDPPRTLLNVNLFIIGSVIGIYLAKIFIFPIVEKGPRQKPDSE